MKMTSALPGDVVELKIAKPIKKRRKMSEQGRLNIIAGLAKAREAKARKARSSAFIKGIKASEKAAKGEKRTLEYHVPRTRKPSLDAVASAIDILRRAKLI